MVDKINKTANLIEVAVTDDYNICNKRLQKIRAHTILSGEIKTLWNLNKVQITPIIVDTMGKFCNKFDVDISKLGLTNHKIRAEEAKKIVLRHFMQSLSFYILLLKNLIPNLFET